MQFAMDKKVADMTFLERKQAYKWVQEHFTVINNNQIYSYSDIILFMEKVMRQQPIDAIRGSVQQPQAGHEEQRDRGS